MGVKSALGSLGEERSRFGLLFNRALKAGSSLIAHSNSVPQPTFSAKNSLLL
jgi:hypothetical protein